MSDGWDGACSVLWCGDELDILAAGPRVTMTAELVDSFRRGYGHPSVSLDGDVLTIRGTNRTVVYVIGEHLPETDTYRAEWPD